MLIDIIVTYIPMNYLILLLQRYNLNKTNSTIDYKLYNNTLLEFWRRIAHDLKQFKQRQTRLKMRYSSLSYCLLPSFQFIICIKYLQELLEDTSNFKTNTLQISQRVVIHRCNYFPPFQQLKYFDNFSKRESKKILFAKVHPSYRIPYYDIKMLQKNARYAMALIY